MQIEKGCASESEKTLTDLYCPCIKSKQKSLYYLTGELLISVLNKIQITKKLNLSVEVFIQPYLGCC